MRRQKDSHEFKPLLAEIEDKPFSPAGRGILWIVIGIIVFASLWLFFAKIDVVVSARGKIVPSGEIKILQPIETGVISKILIKEGDKVEEGQILMRIDPSITEKNLESKMKDLKVLNIEILRLQALIEDIDFKSGSLEDPVYAEQYRLYKHQKQTLKDIKKQFSAKRAQADSELRSAKADVSRLKRVLISEQTRLEKLEEVLDIIARNRYEELLKTVVNLQEEFNIALANKRKARKHLQEIEQEEKVQKKGIVSRWYEELLLKKKESRSLQTEISAIEFQNKKQQITSPVDGYVGKLLVHTEGGVVTPAEKLISIIPENAPLIVKANVLNKDIGFIDREMKASVKVDTFSFQKYGLLDGTVETIANDAIEDEKLGPIYEVKIIPKTNTLIVENRTRKIEPGMSVTAEIKVGKRRVIEFFVYPIIKYLDEGTSVR